MEDFEHLGGARAIACVTESGRGRGSPSLADKVRSGGQDVGRAHRAEIADEPVQRRIGDARAVDVDDRVDEPGLR